MRGVDDAVFFSAPGDLLLDGWITSDEILKSFSHARNNKAAGSDLLSYEFYKNLPVNWLIYIETMFNRILSSERVPNGWSEIEMFMC